MRFVSILVSAAACVSCLPVYAQDSQQTVSAQGEALQKIKQSVEDMINVSTPLKGLHSLILAVTYMKDYKRENPRLIEGEILRTLTIRLQAAGFEVQTYPESQKLMDARIKAITAGELAADSPEPEDSPLMELHVSSFKWLDNTTVVTIDTKLFETGYLARDRKAKRRVISWTAQDIDTDIVENVELREHVLKVSREQIDTFISDWARQNRPR